MLTRTQVSPWILVGDTLADRPPADQFPQGYLFHDTATGDCSITVKSPITQICVWEGFCSGSGASGGSGVAGGALLAWHGGNAAGTPIVAGTNYFIANDPLAINSITPLAYPVGTARTARNFAAHIDVNPSGAPINVKLLLNGVVVATVVGSTPNSFTTVAPGPFTITPGETIDVAFSPSVSESTAIAVSATVEL